MKITDTGHGKASFAIAAIFMILFGLISMVFAVIHACIFIIVYNAANVRYKEWIIHNTESTIDTNVDQYGWQKILKWHAIIITILYVVLIVIKSGG